MRFVEKPAFSKKLSGVAFGGASLSGIGGGYGFGEIGEKQAQSIIESALAASINIYDTAPIYGFHASEKRLGKYLKAVREKVYIVSKGGITWHNSKRVNLSNEPKIIESMLHESLKHLQTDYIDIYMIHWPDPKVDIRFPLEVLTRAQEQKKIKHIGLCNTNEDDYLKSKEVCQIDVLQSECNLFQNQLSQLADYIQSDNLLTMGWGTLDKGILAGTVKTDSKFSEEDARSWAPWWKKSNWREKVLKVQKLESYYNKSIFDLALSYSTYNVDISIAGFKTTKQLEQIINFELIDQDVLTQVVQDARS